MNSTDLEMFMAKLRCLLYENDNNTLIRNNPFIKKRKPQIQLLYEQLAYLMGSCFKDMTIDEEKLPGFEDVGSWKRRLMEAADDAEYAVDMFLSSAIIRNDVSLRSSVPDNVLQLTYPEGADRILDMVAKMKNGFKDILHKIFKFEDYDRYRQATKAPGFKNLKDVMKDLKSIREEMTHKKGNARNFFLNLVMQDRVDNNPEATGTSSSRNTTKHEELIVGFDDSVVSILDELIGDRKKLDIISIVGMGGLGKTTLATKIFNNSFVKYRFDIRGWITVSQAYTKRDMLLQLLASIGKMIDKEATESKLAEMLYKSLKGSRRYLIVIDDIWSPKAWDEVGMCIPDDNTGSRVLVTTRLTEVALHVSRGGFTHNLGHLTEDQSWELLCRKTFRGKECPESLIETGKRIANKCGGLPLVLVVIAGLLEKGEKREELWEKVAESVGSYIINDPKGCMDTLALSYDHLPSHLKNCFLYAGGFPEDYKINVQRLIRLWMAEGFIRESEHRSLEEEGEYYLMDLVDRNLLIVGDRRSSGGIKSCRLHDLLRELCLKKADEENLFMKICEPMSENNPFSDSTSSIVKPRRLFADYEVLNKMKIRRSATRARSVLCFDESRLSDKHAVWVYSFCLLRVLDLLNIFKANLDISSLVHLKYLAVRPGSSFLYEGGSTLSNAGSWSLQTLIVKGMSQSFTYLPDNMVNLRYLRCDGIKISKDFSARTLSNLQTISRLILDHRARFLLQSFPNIKKLGCDVSLTSSNHELLSFPMLTHLEALNIDKYMHKSLTLVMPIRLPETLKKLTLKRLHLPWSCMSTIQQLPNLEVLKLLYSSFKGNLWETGDEQFRQLKFLKLQGLDIRFWEASSINFPSLRKLVVRICENLKEIPLELGNIYTLEHIEIDNTNSRVVESVNRIQEAQREMGNSDLHVNFIHTGMMDLSLIKKTSA